MFHSAAHLLTVMYGYDVFQVWYFLEIQRYWGIYVY